MKLNEIVLGRKEIEQAIQQVEEAGGNADALYTALNEFNLSLEEKLDAIAGIIEENKAKIDWIADKEKKLRAVKKSLSNQNEWLMDYLTSSIDNTGLKEIKTKNFIFKPRNFRASTIIEDETKLPKEFIKTEEVTKIDKKAIFEKLQDGEEVPGAYLKANRKTLIL